MTSKRRMARALVLLGFLAANTRLFPTDMQWAVMVLGLGALGYLSTTGETPL